MNIVQNMEKPMYRHVLTLLRGSAHDTAEQFTDHNALAILRQQIRDSARSIQASRYAIANAIAQYQSELDHQQIVTSKIADLEQRTIIALEKGQDELAQQAAETIAGLEDENETSSAAQKLFREQLANQKAQLREAQSILRELQRGARLAAAADSTRYLNDRAGSNHTGALNAARETLDRLQKRQQQDQRKAEALAGLDRAAQPKTVTEELARAGCGKPLQRTANDVLDRLRTKTKPSKKS